MGTPAKSLREVGGAPQKSERASGARPRSLLLTSGPSRVRLIALASLVSLAAGTFLLVYVSPFSPLIVGGAAVALAICAAWLRKPVWALYAAIFVVFLPEGLVPSQIQSMLNRGVLLIALGVWLLDVITRQRRIVWTSTTLLMLGFLVWGMVTLLWIPNLDVGTETLTQYALRLILYLFLIVNEIQTEETLDGLMRTLAVNGWIVVLAGVGTVLLGGYQLGTRLTVLRMNDNGLGMSMLVTLPGVLWLVMRAPERQKTLRMLSSVVYILLAVFLVALSGSRGSAISWFVTLALFWFWKPMRPWGKLALLILVVMVISAPFVFSITLERFAAQEGGTLGGRDVIWEATWSLIRTHVWQGVGIGNAPYAVVPYLEKLTKLYGQNRDWRAIHNPVLTIWAETGIPGFLLFLSILGSAVWLFVRKCFTRSETGVRPLVPYGALISCVFVGYMLSWIKGGGMEQDPSYFLMLALLVVPVCLNLGGDDAAGSSFQNVDSGLR